MKYICDNCEQFFEKDELDVFQITNRKYVTCPKCQTDKFLRTENDNKYSVKFRVSYRFENPNNKSGYSWQKQPVIVLSGDTIEEIMDKAYEVPAPDDMDIEAMLLQGIVYMPTGKKKHGNNKEASIRIFKEF